MRGKVNHIERAIYHMEIASQEVESDSQVVDLLNPESGPLDRCSQFLAGEGFQEVNEDQPVLEIII